MDIAYKFNFPPPRSNRIFHEYLFTYVSTLHDTYILSKFLSKKKETKRKKEEEEEEIDSKSWNSIYEGYFTGTQKWRATWSGIFDGEEPRSTSIQRQTDSLSSGSPLRSAWSRRSSASKGPVFRAAHDRFAERWAQKKVRASDTQGEEGPRRVLEKRGRGEKCRK